MERRTQPLPSSIGFELPSWVTEVAGAAGVCATDEQRVELAITLARENVERGTGGPFGAAVFARESGALIAVGVNLVEPQTNCVLHAEVVALMLAQQAVASFTLACPPCDQAYVLATSCAPCAMCLGAVHWSGVSRVLAGATREDAAEIGFDEGPVFPESIAYLERNGVEFVQGVAREAAREVLRRYVSLAGRVYNA